MASVVIKPMTAAEFYNFVHRPENRDRVFELERGEVIELSRPGKLHGFICANVAGMLGNFTFARKKGYVCANNAGIVVERDPDTVRGPDITLFEDVASIEEVEEKWGETPPCLSVEVLSPNDTSSKLIQRIREQIAFGVALIWVIDPEARTVTVLSARPGAAHRAIHARGGGRTDRRRRLSRFSLQGCGVLCLSGPVREIERRNPTHEHPHR